MKIQLAIDRVPMERALTIVRQAGTLVDIIEVGTSLIKDFGLSSVSAVKAACPRTAVLADIKTIDEGEYEFQAAYSHGADIATVMGGASLTTITSCKHVANEMGRDYMIDLLEVPPAKMDGLKQFSDAIFCVHLPADKEGDGLSELIVKTGGTLQGVKRRAVAGGVTLSTLEFIQRAGFEIAIVGSAITKSENLAAQARKFSSLARL